jgi:hypothetical protein
MNTFAHHVELAAPLFVLVLAGYLLMRTCGWPKAMSENLSRFVFSVALPAMLFRLMSDLSQLPPVDARLLLAFFGGCLIVFVIGRLVAWRLFALDGVGAVGVCPGWRILEQRAARPAAGQGRARRCGGSFGGAGAGVQRADPVDAADGVDRVGKARQLFATRFCQDGARRADQSDRRRHPCGHAVRPDRAGRCRLSWPCRWRWSDRQRRRWR